MVEANRLREGRMGGKKNKTTTKFLTKKPLEKGKSHVQSSENLASRE